MTSNLPLISRNYFLTYPDQRTIDRQALISSGSQSVFPLLREGVHIFKEFHPLPNLRGVNPEHIVGESPQNLWVRYIVNPAINDIYDIVRLGGEDVQDALVRALYDQDPFIKLLSSLVMLEYQNPNRKLVEQLSRAFEYLKTTEQNKPYYRDSGLIIIISLVLYQGEYPTAMDIVTKWLSEKNTSYDIFRSMWKNTVFGYLFTATTP